MGFPEGNICAQEIVEGDPYSLCGICNELAIETSSVCKEGHTYCSDCIQSWINKDGKTCPQCRAEMPSVMVEGKRVIVPQKVRNDRNRDIRVCCPNVREFFPTKRKMTESKLLGSQCLWAGKLSDFVGSHDRECEFKSLECKWEKCIVRLPRNMITGHMESCQRRTITCDEEGCTETFPYCDRMQHKKVCEFVEIKCPHEGCNLSLKRHPMHTHVQECGHRVIQCPCARFGCTTRLKIIDQVAHCSSVDHSTLTTKMMLELEKASRAIVLSQPNPEAIWIGKGLKKMMEDSILQESKHLCLRSPLYLLGPQGYNVQLECQLGESGMTLGVGTVPGPYDDALVWPMPYSFSITVISQDGPLRQMTVQQARTNRRNVFTKGSSAMAYQKLFPGSHFRAEARTEERMRLAAYVTDKVIFKIIFNVADSTDEEVELVQSVEIQF